MEDYHSNKSQIQKVVGRPDDITTKHTPVEAQIIPLGNDKIIINNPPYHIYTYEGLLAIDPRFGVVDLMAAVIIRIPKPLEELLIVDGEAHKGKLLWRNILVFQHEEFYKKFQGEKSQMLFFGDRKFEDASKDITWQSNLKSELSENPWMVPPLYITGPKLLEKVFGYKKVVPFKNPSHEHPKMKHYE